MAARWRFEHGHPIFPRDVIERFYAAEGAYMNAGGADAGASFEHLADTLDPEVILHQSPDLPWGGEFHGHGGYEDGHVR